MGIETPIILSLFAKEDIKFYYFISNSFAGGFNYLVCQILFKCSDKSI